MKNTNALTLCCLLFSGLTAVQSQAAAPAIVVRWLNANGDAFTKSQPYAAIYNASTECPDKHKTPDKQNYLHGHTGGYGFDISDTRADGGLVTPTMSDNWWKANVYIGYTFVSASSTSLNCYAYAADAPTPMSPAGWRAWTDLGTLSDGSTRKKSYFSPTDHCIVISSVWSWEGVSKVATTIEKNGTGPVFSHGWLPLGASLPDSPEIRNVKATVP
jgi:hypothetical protein